jgi:hypothetical protein
LLFGLAVVVAVVVVWFCSSSRTHSLIHSRSQRRHRGLRRNQRVAKRRPQRSRQRVSWIFGLAVVWLWV